MESCLGCIVWGCVIFIAWLWNFAFGWVLSFARLPAWLDSSISGVMSFASSIVTVSFASQLAGASGKLREVKQFDLVPFLLVGWLIAAASCAIAVLLHFWLLRFQLPTKDHRFYVTFGGLCFAMGVLWSFVAILERKTQSKQL